MLKGLGIDEKGRQLELALDPLDREKAGKLLAQNGIGPSDIVVGLNPSATYGPAKQWPVEHWAELGDRLARHYGARILIFGGPADRDLGRYLTGLMRCRPLDVSGRTTLGQAMALIAACGLFVTNDSGLMHAAAALDRPLVAIFGSTDPVATGPVGPRSQVVRTHLPCGPCLKTHCPLGPTQCMTSVGVDTVWAAVGKLL
jgi:heptosyltransferase-2